MGITVEDYEEEGVLLGDIFYPRSVFRLLVA
jgi:hypothetical protein